MEIQTTTHGDLLVVTPQGRLDSNTSPVLETLLLDRIATGSTWLSIDFSGVTYVSSAGLRVLLVAAKKTSAAKGSFSMHSLSPQIREVFDISGFLSILPVHDGLDGVLTTR